MINDNFTKIPYNISNLDRYCVRISILNSILSEIHLFNGELLDVGCGKMPYRNLIFEKSSISKYIGLDIDSSLVYDEAIKPDFLWDGIKMPFQDNTFDCVIVTEVLEHCSEPNITLNEIYRVLKPDGIVFFTVPFLWPLHEVPHDEYRYTPFSLERLLNKAGFKKIKISPMGGWHMSLAQMLGLWVRRSPMNFILRKVLSFLLMPLIRLLIYKDKKSTVLFSESQMITGLFGTATKG